MRWFDDLKIGARLSVGFAVGEAVSMQVNQIATAAEQQTSTTSEISRNMLEITGVVSHTAQGACESAAAATQLTQSAESLRRLVGQFKLA